MFFISSNNSNKWFFSWNAFISLNSFFSVIQDTGIPKRIFELIVKLDYSNQIKITDMYIQDWRGDNVFEK